jgi:hypothetical protein
MSEATKISESAIRQVEEGQFANIPVAIHAFFEQNLKITGYDKKQVNETYRDFVKWKREQVRLGLTEIMIMPYDARRVAYYIKPDEHPFNAYLGYIGALPTLFCQNLCIPKSAFFKYLGGKQRTMPHSMRIALHDVGLSFTNDIDELDSLGTKFYDNMRARR